MVHDEDIPFDFVEFVCRERQIGRETAEELLRAFVRDFYRGVATSPAVAPSVPTRRRLDLTISSGGTPPWTTSFEPL